MADKNRQMNKDWKNTVRQAQLDAAAYGQSEFGRELTSMELSAGDLSGPVQEYVNQMLQLVRQAESSVGNLISVAPLIDEMAKLGGQDPALQQWERTKVLDSAKQLKSFIQKHASVMARVKKPKFVSRERAAEMREKSADYLKDSESDTFRVAGHLLGRKWRKEKTKEDNSAFEKARLEARSALWTKADENLQATNEERETAKKAKAAKHRPRTAAEFFGGRETGRGGGEIGGELLSTNKEILENIKHLVALMTGDLEAQRRAAEAAARNADNRADKPIVLQDTETKKLDTSERREGEDKGSGGFRLPRLRPRTPSVPTQKPPTPTPAPKPPVAKPPGYTPLGGGIGSTVSFLGGAALGAAYFLAGFKAIGEGPISTKAVFDQAQNLGLEIGNKGANELRERIKIYDAMIQQGQDEAVARKAANAANAVEEKDGKWGPAKVPSGFQQGASVTGGASVEDVKPKVQPPSGFAPGTTVPGGASISSAPPTPAPPPPSGFEAGSTVSGGKSINITPPPAPKPPSPQKLNRTALLAQIMKGEGAGYDTTYGNGAFRPGGRTEERTRPISRMTMRELYALQTEMIKRSSGKVPGTSQGSSAAGKYQVIRTTLFGKNGTAEKPAKGSLANILGLKASDVFTPEVQESIGQILLDRRGASKFERGELSAKDFQKNLAREWASIADPETGKSFYGQATGTSTRQVQAILASSATSPVRSAGTLGTATAAARPTAIVNAPQTTLVTNLAGGGTQSIIVPMQTRNPDTSLAAAQMLNVPVRG